MSESFLLVSILSGVLGMSFCVFGRRQRKPVPFAVGVALGVSPYFVSDPLILTGVAACLIAVAYFVRV